MTTRKYMFAAIAMSVLAVAGCKKDTGNKEIELPEGQVHVGAQWAGGSLWVESFDPRTATCEFSEYKGGKIVEDSTITFKNCRTGLGGPMMRPMMPGAAQGQPGVRRPDMGRPGMNRPEMNRPGVNQPNQPELPAAGQAAPVAPQPEG